MWDTSTPGIVVIRGNLEMLDPGYIRFISYNIPITDVSAPGQYIINNTATAISTNTQDSASCHTALNTVQLSADKCCVINGSNGIYRLSVSSVGQSPCIIVDVFDNLQIPAGVIVRFNSFGGCNAFFSGTTNPVLINTNISGPVNIDIECEKVLIQTGNTVFREISYTLVSSSIVGTASIANTLSNIVAVNPAEQILLGVDNLPVSANIDVTLNQTCQDPC